MKFEWNDFLYDVESLPNIFTAVVTHAASGTEWIFEVSERKNQSVQFLTFLRTMAQNPNNRLVGFNNNGYDYPLLHFLLHLTHFDAATAYQKSKQIINTPWNDRFRHTVRASDVIIKQVDLFKVHHFDNKARRTSLKQIEIALRMSTVVEFQLDFDAPLPRERIPLLLAYNRHDVRATFEFWKESRKQLEFRDQMTAELGEDMTNQSDSNIGSKVFVHALEQTQPGICGKPGKWRQTHRSSIKLGDCVFDYVQFETEPFREVLEYFQNRTITKTKDAFKLEADNMGMLWHFGTGGIHAAKDGRTWRAGDGRVVQARDVKSYYPNLSIRNGVYPEHLSMTFCEIYEKLYDERAATPKKDPKNDALKLALNGTYGNSNSVYSPFYDPKFTMTITINGQLLLCMLAEWLNRVPTLDLIQANTDGIMYAVNEEWVWACDDVSRRWEELTNLVLETDDFDLFAQRDVNNYLARDVSGSLKSKGAFEYQHGLDSHEYKKPGDGGNWHKNQSSKIIAIAAEKCLCEGVPVAQTVTECDNPFYFMQTLKVNRTDRVMLGGDLSDYLDMYTGHLPDGWEHDLSVSKTHRNKDGSWKGVERKRHGGGVEQQRVGRYYATHRGEQLYKIMKPLPKLPHHDRPQAILKGVPVQMCNDVHFFDWNNLNRDWYTEQAQELVDATQKNNPE